MIDPSRRLLFTHVARTGGTSVETALIGKDWWQVDPDSKHISASQARALYGEDVWCGFTKFSIVRNPWDRVVSMWATGWWWDERTHLQGRQPPSLSEFVATLAPHPHERYQSLHYDEILEDEQDFVLRFESLQRDFSAMLATLGLPDVALPHVEGREHAHYRSYYDAESVALVAQRFAADIRRYEYSF